MLSLSIRHERHFYSKSKTLTGQAHIQCSEADIDGMRKSGRIVAQVLWEMINHLRPGMTSVKLDEIAEKYFKMFKANSAPKRMGFPCHTCISVNEIIAHGVPDKRILRCGDKINIDVSAEHNGYYSDVAYTVIIGESAHETNPLLACAKRATLKAIDASIAGTPINEISKIIEQEVRQHGYTIIKNLCSHGVGKCLHAFPKNILNYHNAEETIVLEEGMFLAWEPYVSSGATRAIGTDNDWNLTTHDQSEVAQFEHTILVTNGKPEILTVLP